ncbi:MAG TPA: hypothetical protein VGG14_11640, partial [Candidatus Sulfotelmatobacter sp.]
MATLQQAVAGFSWDNAVSFASKQNRIRLSPAAIKGVLRIATHWNLRDDDTRALLGGLSTGSFYNLKSHGAKLMDED